MDGKKELKKKLNEVAGLEVKENTPLSSYTSFKVGGPADIFIVPETVKELREAIKIINNSKLPWFILGKGSNVIASDRGYRGVIIFTGELTSTSVDNNSITAETGITLNKLAGRALEAGLKGLEFAAGIPGTLGGALFMNAGAYGGEIKDLLETTEVINPRGEKKLLSKKEMDLSYRNSRLQNQPLIATRATLQLKPGNKETIKQQMRELNDKRHRKQPLSWPSAGSAFKRPEGHYAGKLIEEAGMKGTRVGGAQVSKKHAGFIINLGNASATDIKKLIKTVQKEVYRNSGVHLEPEPKFLGEFERSN
ncbi:MAG: UDP-N-acetylmuramate dehydrogenase [Halanaerobiales bacterium]